MNQFSIDFQWLSREYGDPITRVTLADIAIAVDGRKATELEDLLSRTVRPGVRASAYSLALWFASNWWRLRWEPEKNSSDWEMSHKIAAAGEGYLWPDLSFISDGGAVLVHAKSSPLLSEHLVRYLNDIDQYVPAGEFEMVIDTFIEAVLDRLNSVGVEADDLAAIWKEVSLERRDPAVAAWRKLEALLGFDPGDAPDHLIEELQKAGSTCGINAVEEIVAASSGEALTQIHALWDGPRQIARTIHVPDLDRLRSRLSEEIPLSLFPWQQAAQAASLAREVWSLGTGPIATSTLSEIFEIAPQTIDQASDVDVAGPMNAGFRNGHADTFDVFLKSPYPVNRRFALLRLIGDHLTAPPQDKLLPATPRAGTQRQKFQRAFAQEFLCPYADLVKYLGETEPTDDVIEDAAHYFDVSSQMVETILVNKGEVSRERLSAELRR